MCVLRGSATLDSVIVVSGAIYFLNGLTKRRPLTAQIRLIFEALRTLNADGKRV